MHTDEWSAASAGFAVDILAGLWLAPAPAWLSSLAAVSHGTSCFLLQCRLTFARLREWREKASELIFISASERAINTQTHAASA